MHIKKIASARAAYPSDCDDPVRIPRRKKDKTGVFRSNKSPKRAHDRHHSVHSYCVLLKKAGMSERKYLLHISEDCTGVRTKLPIKDGMGGPMGIRTNTVQQYKKFEKNGRRI